MTVELWLLDLAGATHVCESAISPAERERAKRYVHPAARIRFLAGRALARRVIAARLGIEDPAALDLVIGPHGRPEIASGEISFNLAHSGESVLLALAPGRVGVDVERRRPARVTDSLFERCLTASERAEADSNSFFTLWAAKEACMKAVGLGLGIDPTSFAAPRPWGGVTPTPVAVPGRHPVAALGLAWIDAGPDYAAAVAAPGAGWGVRVHTADASAYGCR